jgi:hypothetical protein
MLGEGVRGNVTSRKQVARNNALGTEIPVSDLFPSRRGGRKKDLTPVFCLIIAILEAVGNGAGGLGSYQSEIVKVTFIPAS